MIVLPSKTSGETVSHRWEPDLEYGESVSSVLPSVDDGTITLAATVETDSGKDGVTFFVSGGVVGEFARFSLTVATSEGRTIVGVFHIAVRSEAPVLANTARDVCNFALRKITGVGENAEAEELDDALERLNAMLMLWRMDGLDVGIPGVLEAGDVLEIPDPFISAIKYCLREQLHAFYGEPLNAYELGLVAQSKNALAAVLTNFDDLGFDRALIVRNHRWDFARGS